MQNVVVCDRDEAVIKDGQNSFKLSIEIENNVSGKKLSVSQDLCEGCTGIIVRSVAQRVFLDESKEHGMLSEIGCAAAPRKEVKKSKSA